MVEEFTRTYSVIHLDAIYRNIEEARKRIGNDTKIMAIVKANAYGHGAVEVDQAFLLHVAYPFIQVQMLDTGCIER